MSKAASGRERQRESAVRPRAPSNRCSSGMLKRSVPEHAAPRRGRDPAEVSKAWSPASAVLWCIGEGRQQYCGGTALEPGWESKCPDRSGPPRQSSTSRKVMVQAPEVEVVLALVNARRSSSLFEVDPSPSPSVRGSTSRQRGRRRAAPKGRRPAGCEGPPRLPPPRGGAHQGTRWTDRRSSPSGRCRSHRRATGCRCCGDLGGQNLIDRRGKMKGHCLLLCGER